MTLGIPYSQKIPSELHEAALRATDEINRHLDRIAWWDIRNCWVAIRLADGTSDGTLYDSKRDAVRHQSDEKLCAYVSFRNLGPSGANARELAVFLKFNRDAYNAGLRLPDPDDVSGGPQPLMTTRWRDYFRGKMGL